MNSRVTLAVALLVGGPVLAAAAPIQVVPAAVDADTVKVGSTFRDTVVVSGASAAGEDLSVQSVTRVPGLSQWSHTVLGSLPFAIAGSADQLPVEVRLLPDAASTFDDTLIITYDSGTVLGKTVAVPLSGAGGLGDLELSDTSVAFGSVAVGSQKRDTVWVYNVGSFELTVNLSLVGGGSSFAFSPQGFGVPIGESVLVELTFAPPVLGAHADFLRVATDAAANETLLVSLTGTGLAPRFRAAPPDSLAFGDVRVGTARDDTLLVTNTGNSDLVISALSGPGAGPFGLVVVPAIPLTIVPSATALWVVRFAPAAPGPRLDSLRFSTNVPGNANISYYLRGRGVEPDIDVSPASLDFGAVPILSGGDTLQIDLRNLGSGALRVDSVRRLAGLGEYTLVSIPADGSTIAPSGSAVIRVEFDPVVPDSTFRDTVVIYSDDPDEAVVKVALQGRSVVAVLRLSRSSLNFDTVFFGDTRPESLYVVNDGSDTLRYSTASLSDPAQFAVSPGLAAIPPRDSQKVVITYAPVSAGAAVATWELVTNAPATPLATVSLAGFGRSRLAAPSAIDFGTIAVGTSSLRVLVLRNAAPAGDTVRIDSIRVVQEVALVSPPLFPLILAPGASDTLALRWTPSFAGTLAARLKLSYTERGAGSDSLQINLSGSALTVAATIVRLINYPNPFVPEDGSTLLFGLSRTADVTLRIYDLAGQMLAEPVTQITYAPGEHEVIWNGRRGDDRFVAYGVYICELVARPAAGGEEDRAYRKLACGRR